MEQRSLFIIASAALGVVALTGVTLVLTKHDSGTSAEVTAQQFGSEYDSGIADRFKAFLGYHTEHVPVSNNQTHTQEETPALAVRQEGIPAGTIPVTGISWHEVPQQIQDLGLLFSKTNAEVEYGIPKYYELGTMDDGQRVIALEVPPDGMAFGPNPLYYLVQTEPEHYEFLVQHMYDAGVADVEAELERNGTPLKWMYSWSDLVTFDTEHVIPELYGASIVVTKGTMREVLKPLYRDPEILQSNSTLQQTEIAGIYSSLQPKDNSKLASVSIYRKLASGMFLRYTPKFDFVSDDGVPRVTWNDGTHNTESYRRDGYSSCGGGGSIGTIPTLQNEDVAVAGVTAQGEPVYTFRSVEHPIVSEYFAMTRGERYVWNKETQNGKTIPFTISEYLQDHGLFIYKDILGNNVIFSSNKYGPAAECGKPVVYLYPEKTTQVSVRVNADVTVSVPDYPTYWDVIAHPNGLLETSAGEYDSLFWEGFGKGTYPTITKGVIVSRAAVEQTLKVQLSQLGLNTKEQHDFLEFWLPRMPETPYVRLSWLGTRDMDILAPLNVTPKPQTSIRVFLDFEGVTTPYPLEPQALTTIPRKGFTLVEWGGLLRTR